MDAATTSIKTHTDNKSNPHGVTKAQIGLSNVDNTSDKSLLTALSNSNNGVSITVGGTTKSISNISAGEINKTLASSGTIAQTNLIKVSGTTDGYQLVVKADTSDSLEVQHILTDDVTIKEVWYGNSTAMMTLQPVGNGTSVTGGNLTINGNVSATNTEVNTVSCSAINSPSSSLTLSGKDGVELIHNGTTVLKTNSGGGITLPNTNNSLRINNLMAATSAGKRAFIVENTAISGALNKSDTSKLAFDASTGDLYISNFNIGALAASDIDSTANASKFILTTTSSNTPFSKHITGANIINLGGKYDDLTLQGQIAMPWTNNDCNTPLAHRRRVIRPDGTDTFTSWDYFPRVKTEDYDLEANMNSKAGLSSNNTFTGLNTFTGTIKANSIMDNVNNQVLKGSSFRLGVGTYTLQTLLKMVFTTIPSNYMVTINCPSGNMTTKDEDIGSYENVHCWNYDNTGYQAADYYYGNAYVHDGDSASTDSSKISINCTSAIQVIISC